MKIKLLLFLLFLAPAIVRAADIEIFCQKSAYKPDAITVKKEEPVKITLKSLDVTHGFAIDALKIAVEVSPGSPTVVRFTPDRAGKFDYYCVVHCGKKHLQMRGTLTVTE